MNYEQEYDQQMKRAEEKLALEYAVCNCDLSEDVIKKLVALIYPKKQKPNDNSNRKGILTRN
jgi:hypothetical protein